MLIEALGSYQNYPVILLELKTACQDYVRSIGIFLYFTSGSHCMQTYLYNGINVNQNKWAKEFAYCLIEPYMEIALFSVKNFAGEKLHLCILSIYIRACGCIEIQSTPYFTQVSLPFKATLSGSQYHYPGTP